MRRIRGFKSLFGFRRVDGERWVHWHAINENERLHGGHGPWWQNWRGWLHFYGFREDADRRCASPCIGIEWVCWPKANPGFAVGFELNGEFGDDHDLAGRLCFGRLFRFYWHCEHVFPRKFKNWLPQNRNFGIELFEEYLWVKFFFYDESETWKPHDHGVWSRWNGFRISWDWKSALMGKTQFTQEVVGEPTLVLIPLPEANYIARVQIERRTWQRSRWPWSLKPFCVRTEADIDIPDGLPVPGKGENSYDCGEDAIHGMGCSETDLPSVIAACVKATMKRRAKYATIDWRPREKSAV